tara:strand:+ start:1748 stop:2389 length:642 start_codon:yes stop_codon:yes gene_type:complete
MVKKTSKVENRKLRILGLYLADYKIEFHVREIARRLDFNHRTVLLVLQKLEEKNVLNSKLIGRNKVYSLNTDNVVTREYITSAEIARKVDLLDREFLFKKLVQEILLDVEYLPVVLFGSYAKGNETKQSDIDIIIFMDQSFYTRQKEKKIQKRILAFASKYRKKIQIQKGSRSDFEKGLREKDPLVMEIVKDHVILNNYQFFIGMLWRYAHER